VKALQQARVVIGRIEFGDAIVELAGGGGFAESVAPCFANQKVVIRFDANGDT